MAIFEALIVELWNVWMDMLAAIWSVIPKIFSVGLWGIAALIILPCVFVSSVVYPHWVEWGEDF